MPERKVTRRTLAKGAALAAGGAALHVDTADAHGWWGRRRWRPEDDDDVALVNANILTLDGRDTRAGSVAIRGDRIVEVGRGRNVRGCKRTIDLRGATVVPGLIDSHQHFIRACHNPGYETRGVEAATSIAEVQAALAARTRTVPVGGMLTCIGGWTRNGLAEKRLPTPAEHDAAAPQHAVYLSETGGGGQADTNHICAAIIAGAGVAVDAATGTLNAGQGRNALVAVQTADDKRRGTREGIAWVNSLGLTTIADVGGVLFADWVYPSDLWRAGELNLRLRQFFTGFDFPTLDGLKNFINYNHNLLGDDLFRVVGVGERLTAGSPSAATVAEALQFFGEKGWTFCVHSLSAAENQMHVDALKTAAQTFDVAALRWQLHHLNDMPANLLAELAALKVPVGIQGWRYTSASGGSPWRTALDLGLAVGAGTDATNVAAQNPWLVIYHMVTGRNNAGTVTNPGQQVTRLEALRMYTLGSAYLTRDEEDLGSIEEGKLADLVVLNDNYLQVPDEKIKKLASDLTIVGGRVVHAAGRYRNLL
jgi:predicted amidohydrolase YtcJ